MLVSHHRISIAILLLSASSVGRGEADSLQSASAFHGYPYVYYTPETDWAFGAMGIIIFRTGTGELLNPSSLTLDGYYTVKRQYDISALPEIYFNEDRLLLTGVLEYGRIVDKYWGIGPHTGDSDSTQYVKGIFRIQARAQAVISGRLKCGLLVEFDRAWMIDKRDNPLLASNTVAGSSGATLSGAGVALSWDTRDNIYYPSGGMYHQFEHVVFGAFMGSNFAFERTLLDLRSYFDIGSRHIIAVQAGGMIAGGTPPFYRYALFGGDGIMRGYYTGRYRDRILLYAQAEYRKMFLPRFGAAAFAGGGDVAPRFAGFQLSDIKPSYGAGLRFMVDTKEQLTARIDVGFGRSTNGVYLAVREAF